MIRINDNIFISKGEFIYRFTRSSGPGGQNVNKLNTRVTLLFDVANSHGLTSEQKQIVFDKLSSRISDDGFLKVASQRHRTQRANRRAALERFVDLLSDALKELPVREQTEIPYSAKIDRIMRKRHHSEIKQLRKPVNLGRFDE